MTDSGENGDKHKSRDPKNIASLLLVAIAVIMLALLVRNCVTDNSEDTSSNSEREHPLGTTGYADDSVYILDYTHK